MSRRKRSFSRSHARVDLAHGESPPRRLIAGSDVIGVAEAKAAELQERADLDRRPSASLALAPEPEPEPEPAGGSSGSGA